MGKFNKLFNLRIIFTTACGILFLFINTVHSCPILKDSLRPHIGNYKRLEKRIEQQKATETDVVISSSATQLQHEDYNEIVTKNGKVLAKFAQEIGADKIDRLPNGDYDFRTAIMNFESATSASHIRKLTPFLERFRKRATRTANGDLIVTIEANKSYLIVSSEKDPITDEQELIFIGPDFSADHAGRRRNQVYARTLAKAVHELTELRLWKALEKGLISGLDGLDKEIIPDTESDGPHNIQEWTRANISRAVLLDAYFHQLGLEMEDAYESDLFVGTKKQDEIVTTSLISYLRYHIPKAVKNNYSVQFSLEEELAKYPDKRVSFEEMLSIFKKGAPEDKVRLISQPTPDQLEILSNEASFEVGIFQRKSTGEWFAIRGYEEDSEAKIRSASLSDSIISLGKKPPRVESLLELILNVYNDVSYDYHSHPRALSEMLIPTSPGDFIYALNKKGRKVAGVGDSSYVYVYSVAYPDLTEVAGPQLSRKLNNEHRKIKSRLSEDGVLSYDNGVYRPITSDANDRFFEEWKTYVESLGFGLERYTWSEFKEKEGHIYGKFADSTPHIENMEEVIIQSEKSDSDSENYKGARRAFSDFLIGRGDKNKQIVDLPRLVDDLSAMNDSDREKFLEWVVNKDWGQHDLDNSNKGKYRSLALLLMEMEGQNRNAPAMILWNFLSRKLGASPFHPEVFVDWQSAVDQNQLSEVLSIAERYGLRAHGTLNYSMFGISSYSASDSFFQNEWKMLNVMINEDLSHGSIGPLVPLDVERRPSYATALYGPFYIIVHDPQVGTQEPYETHLSESDQISREDQLIYLIPSEREALFFKEGINEALRIGLIKQENAEAILSKLMTYKQFVSYQSHIPEILNHGKSPKNVMEKMRRLLSAQSRSCL